MRLGFLGVGPWSQKLATAFRECGAEIVAYDRQHPGNTEGFGSWVQWRDMIESATIDALILCAPPEVTTEAALVCAKAGKRCVATKPLMLTAYPPLPPPEQSFSSVEVYQAHRLKDYAALDTSLYVDLWRLYSPAWIAMKEELWGKKIERVDVAFCGNGPFRSFPGVLDYGPHAMAFVFDLLGTTEMELRQAFAGHESATVSGVMLGLEMSCGETTIVMRIGNGTEKPERRVTVTTGDKRYTWSEPEGGRESLSDGRLCELLVCEKSVSLRRFCRAFMAGESSRTLEYSCAAQRVLEGIVGDGK